MVIHLMKPLIIKNICNKNSINCIFFINPIHNTTYQFTNHKLLYSFREQLSKITDYYDFSHPNYISMKNQFWQETSHYHLNVGDLIIDKIYNSINYKDFGALIKYTPPIKVK